MAVTEPETLDVDAAVVNVEQFLRMLLPADWVAAIDASDFGALAAVRHQVDADELWKRIGAAGFIAPTWPEEYGGLGADRKVGAAIARTLGPLPNPALQQRGRCRPGRARHPALGHRRAEAAICARDRATKTSGASSSPSPVRAPTSRAWRARPARR